MYLSVHVHVFLILTKNFVEVNPEYQSCSAVNYPLRHQLVSLFISLPRFKEALKSRRKLEPPPDSYFLNGTSAYAKYMPSFFNILFLSLYNFVSLRISFYSKHFDSKLHIFLQISLHSKTIIKKEIKLIDFYFH